MRKARRDNIANSKLRDSHNIQYTTLQVRLVLETLLVACTMEQAKMIQAVLHVSIVHFFAGNSASGKKKVADHVGQQAASIIAGAINRPTGSVWSPNIQ
jgi:hypothetical protein